jgi:zinc transport system substrate-binding protein
MPRSFAFATALFLVFALVAGACGADGDGGAGEPGDTISVIASFYPLAEIARRVGGDAVRVDDLTPAGVEPHDLELTPDQVDDLEDADLVLFLGGGFQPAVEKVADRRGAGAVDVLDAVELDEGAGGVDDHGDEGEDAQAAEDEHADEEHADANDPHFWLDPVRMRAAVGLVEEALAEVAPDHADAFAANARTYQAALSALDEEFATALATCERRTIVTSHAAFHYLADRYDLEQRPISGLSPEAEPEPRRLAELSDLIEEEGVTVVFYETLVDADVARTLAREAKVETAVLNPLEGLTDADVDDGKDYAAVMRENLQALRSALGCR